MAVFHLFRLISNDWLRCRAAEINQLCCGMMQSALIIDPVQCGKIRIDPLLPRNKVRKYIWLNVRQHPLSYSSIHLIAVSQHWGQASHHLNTPQTWSLTSVLLVPLKLRDLVISAMRSAVLALEVLLLPGRAAVLLEANACFSFCNVARASILCIDYVYVGLLA